MQTRSKALKQISDSISQSYFYQSLIFNKWKSEYVLSKNNREFIEKNKLILYNHPLSDIIQDVNSQLWYITNGNIYRFSSHDENVTSNEMHYYGFNKKYVILVSSLNQRQQITIEQLQSVKLVSQIYKQWIDLNLSIFINALDSSPSRKRNINGNTKIDELLQYKIKSSDWISPSAMKNYVIGTALNDVLVLKNQKLNKYEKETDLMTLKRFNAGNQFEKDVIECLRDNYTNLHTVCDHYTDSVLFSKFMMTIQYMELKYPIIYQPVLLNCMDKTYGMPDLLVMGYHINELFNTDIIESQYYNYYFIVDIKSTNFNVSAHTGSVLSTSRLIDFYKVQLYTYNLALGLLQSWTPPMGFLLYPGSDKKKNQQHTILKINNKPTSWCTVYFNDPSNKEDIDYLTGMSEISKHGIDNQYKNSISWIKNVRMNYQSWDLENPHIIELVPNIKSQYDTHAIKKSKHELIKKQSDNGIENLTILWNCTDRQQNCGWKNQVLNWKKDERALPSLLGFREETKRNNILNIIIKMNQVDELYQKNIKKINAVDDVYFGNLTKNIKPTNKSEIYVDLEFVTGKDLIYMIGIGWAGINGQYEYDTIIAQELTYNAETSILKEFYYNYINNKNPTIITWGHVEQTTLSRKMPNKAHLVDPTSYLDLCQLFQQTPIIPRGSLNFGLKSVAGALKGLHHIETFWTAIKYKKIDKNEMTPDILEYLVDEYYTNNKADALKQISVYNFVDTKILWEILNWLRIKIL